jgi:hypothetical protein
VTVRSGPELGLPALLALLVLACLLGGCATSSAATSGDPGYEISVGHVAGLGRVLVDSIDRTGFCAVQWPPLLVAGGQKGARFGPGVNPALVGTVRRADGSLQLTYNGWPLYTWRLDRIPGQATGEGDDMGLWFVISPSGNAIN